MSLKYELSSEPLHISVGATEECDGEEKEVMHTNRSSAYERHQHQVGAQFMNTQRLVNRL